MVRMETEHFYSKSKALCGIVSLADLLVPSQNGALIFIPNVVVFITTAQTPGNCQLPKAQLTNDKAAQSSSPGV